MAFIRTFSDQNVGVLGEIGLDWTVSSHRWLSQERQFTHFLGFATSKDVVVVLHLRGMSGDALGREVYLRGLAVAGEVMKQNKQQIFHLHCFTGPPDVVRAWLQRFPNTYFGITNLAARFNFIQCEGLRAIPSNRLLLETDAPYFPPPKYHVNAPHLLGFTADLIAGIRGVSCEDILTVTTENALRIYIGTVPSV